MNKYSVTIDSDTQRVTGVVARHASYVVEGTRWSIAVKRALAIWQKEEGKRYNGEGLRVYVRRIATGIEKALVPPRI